MSNFKDRLKRVWSEYRLVSLALFIAGSLFEWAFGFVGGLIG